MPIKAITYHYPFHCAFGREDLAKADAARAYTIPYAVFHGDTHIGTIMQFVPGNTPVFVLTDGTQIRADSSQIGPGPDLDIDHLKHSIITVAFNGDDAAFAEATIRDPG